MWRSVQMSDPFEANITQILEQRKAVAAAILASNKAAAAGAPSSEPEEVPERLPFNLAKTQRMLDQNEYEKAKKKAAKKST